MDLRERIKAHRQLITDRLDPYFGILDELLSNRSLTRPEISKVKDITESYGRREKLLEYVTVKGIYDEFLTALGNTEQTHLVNYIQSNGERRSEFGDDWPLTERDVSILDNNQRSLVDLLETSDLLPLLYSRKVISSRQRDFVSSKTTSHEKNDAFLEIIRRTSLGNYKKTIHCLHLSKQSHIARLLEEGGGIVRVHSELETASNVNQVEDELITKFTEMLRDRSLEESTQVLERTRLHLIATKRDQSIILYFYCKTTEEFVNLKKMHTSGELANVIREMFNEILSREEVIDLRTSLCDENCADNFELGLRRVGARGELEKRHDKDDGSASSSKMGELSSFGKEEIESVGDKSKKQLREITECLICMNAFTDPRMLPCIHTFCFECLKQTAETEQRKPGDKMPCPLCRKEFIIPADGVNGIRKNFFMENLLEFRNTLQTGIDPTICDMCNVRNEGKEGQIPKATMRCVECKDNYCDGCAKMHQFQKVTKYHQMVDISNDIISERKRLVSVKSCTQHIHKPLDYYCAECKKIVCVSCFVESHSSHKCKEMTTVDEDFRQQIEKKALKTSYYADEMLLIRSDNEKKKAAFLSEIDEKEKEILRKNQELKDMIDKHTLLALNDLSRIKSQHLKEIENQMEEIDRCCTILKSFETYCTELTSTGSASDICSSFDQLITRAEELERDHEAFIGRPFQTIEVSFKAQELGDILQNINNNLVGNVEAKTETKTKLEDFAFVVRRTTGVMKINLHRPNEISTQEKFPTKIDYPTVAAVYCNTMYITGIGENDDEIWKYSRTSGWVKCTSLVQRRRGHCTTFVNEVLYICGGISVGIFFLDSVEAYNAITNKCNVVGKLVHSGFVYSNCVPFKSSLYIFGGINEYELRHVQVYNTKSNTCSVLSKSMPRACPGMRAVLWETSVILFGGDYCFIFNLEKETWKGRKWLKTGLSNFGLVLDNEKVFIIGEKDVRYVPLRNILDDKQIKWKIHATIPETSVVYDCVKMRLSA